MLALRLQQLLHNGNAMEDRTMATFEHYLAYGISKTKQSLRALPTLIAHGLHNRRYGVSDLAGLWREVPDPQAFGAVLDILGFSALMRRYPSGGHIQMHTFQTIASNAVTRYGNGNVHAALVSDSALLVANDLNDVAAVAMDIIYRSFLSNTTMLIHGYIDQGDFRLVLPNPSASQAPNIARIHWAGQGVLGIGKEELLLPKGAALFLSDRARAGSLPVTTQRFLWSQVTTLDWTDDPQRARQLSVIWNNVNHNCPANLEHVIATKQWLRRAAARRGVVLAEWAG